MKPCSFALTLSVATLLCSACRGEHGPPLPALIDRASVDSTGDVGLATPENLVYDSLSDVILIANMNGGSAAQRGRGFITRMSPEGAVLTLKWIDGSNPATALDAPKGLALRGDTLYVVDIGRIRLFDRLTGAALGERAVPGAALNDLVFDGAGNLYVTDTGGDRSGAAPATDGSSAEASDTTGHIDGVFRVDAAGAASAVARGTRLERPDGIEHDGTGLLIAPIGGTAIYRLDAAGVRTPFVDIPTGSLDGLYRLPDGTLLVTSWDGHAVYEVSPAGRVQTLITDIDSPAGIGIDTRRNQLLITSYSDSRLYRAAYGPANTPAPGAAAPFASTPAPDSVAK
jgi:sugar lactone lactonase YvrE